MKLYGYYRSSATYRVRIALELKELQWEVVPVHLTRGGGEQHAEDFSARNPQKLVPVLEDGGVLLTQSLAIVEYLDEKVPDPPLLPDFPAGRARVRALAQSIACDVHPLNNLRVLAYLTRVVGVSDEQRLAWYRHWIDEGLSAVERQLSGSPDTGRFCHGDRPTLADVCLVPQVYNARRFDCDLSAMPTIVRIETECLRLPAFDRARPEKQPDAE